MKQFSLAALVLAAAATPAAAADAITGDYVEARTAEVFAGGCIMNMEGETSGREAVLAWRVGQGAWSGVALDGLKVVAIVTGDVNLGTRELGGAAPSIVNSIVLVDDRATAAQRDALVSLARSLSNGLVGPAADVRPASVTFEKNADAIRVEAGAARLSVATRLQHDPSCGAVRWFDPLGRVDEPTIGLTRLFAFGDGTLGRRWQQVDRRSAFFGTFSLR